MTFLDVDVIRILEEVLPAKVGGAPTDYQLCEEEGEDGRPRLRLLVHPAVGRADPGRVKEAFLEALAASGGGPQRVMSLVWWQGDLLTVERRPPRATPTGKILHLHVPGPRADAPRA
jgi:hypothetical protein